MARKTEAIPRVRLTRVFARALPQDDVMYYIKDQTKSHRVRWKDVFEDYDKHHNNRISAPDFKRGVASTKIYVSPQRAATLAAAFASGKCASACSHRLLAKLASGSEAVRAPAGGRASCARGTATQGRRASYTPLALSSHRRRGFR